MVPARNRCALSPAGRHARSHTRALRSSGRQTDLSVPTIAVQDPSDNDAPFIELLGRDPQALIVFFEGQATGQTLAFGRRLEQALRRRNVPPRQQFKFLPRLPRDQFLNVMGISDVMIDTLRWSGGNTTLDVLASALPIVTLEGRFMRGRQTAAMLRILGIEELIATDEEQYVALALRVGSDATYRAELSARIRNSLPKLIDRREPIAALGRALERIAAS